MTTSETVTPPPSAAVVVPSIPAARPVRPAADQRAKLLRLLARAGRMVETYQEWLDTANAAIRDEDEGDLEEATEQLTYVLLELSVDTRNVLYAARGLGG